MELKNTKETSIHNKANLIIFILTVAACFFLLFMCLFNWHNVSQIFLRLIRGGALLKEFVQGLGFGGIAAIFSLISLLFFFPFISSLPLQIAAGISYGTIYGTLLISAALFFSSQLVYLFYKNINMFTRSPKKIAARKNLEDKIRNSGKNMVVVLFLAYLVPGIPFILIAVVGAVSGVKWWQYTIFSVLGPIDEVYITLLIGNAVVGHSPLLSAIFLGVILILLACSLIFKDKIVDLIFKPRKWNIEEELRRKRPKLPNKFLYGLVYYICKFFVLPKFRLRVKGSQCVKKNKEQFVYISNHSSRLDFLYTGSAVFPRRINYLIGHYEMYNKTLSPLLNALGTIPKYLYQPDIKAIKKVLRIKARGGNIGFFPEGILSVSGRSKPTNPSSGKLIKLLGLRVVLGKVNGAYLTRTKYCKGINRGGVEVEVSEILSAAQVASMTADEIQTVIAAHIRHDDYEWAKENNAAYKPSKLGFAHNLHNILFVCPHCQSEFSLTGRQDTISCTKCGYYAKLDNMLWFKENADFPRYYQTIAQWYEKQEQVVAQQLSQPSFRLEDFAKLTVLDKIVKRNNPEIDAGEGKISFDSDGFCYNGTMFDKPFQLKVSIENMPSIGFGSGKCIEFYLGENYYCFYPKRAVESVKWTLSAEQLFAQKIGTWKR